MKQQEQVREFHKKILGEFSPIGTPRLPDDETRLLRARLIAEEAAETVVALVGRDEALKVLIKQLERAASARRAPNLVEAIDGLCDVLYVVLGTAEKLSCDIEPFFDEVHRSNMTKGHAAAPDGTPGKKGSKGPGFERARIAEMLHVFQRDVA